MGFGDLSNIGDAASRLGSAIQQADQAAREAAQRAAAQLGAQPAPQQGQPPADASTEAQLANSPHLQGVYNATAASTGNLSSAATFNMGKLFIALSNLGQALNGLSVAYANSLNITSDQMNNYAKLMTQIPVVTKSDIKFDGDDKADADKRAIFNQKFANMLEALRANKGVEEDKAKKIQTLMQSQKDAGQSFNDLLGSLIDGTNRIIQGIFK